MDDSVLKMNGAGIIYRCPLCQGKIVRGDNLWRCACCGKEFKVWRSVAILNVNDELVSKTKHTSDQTSKNAPLFTTSPPSGSITTGDSDKFLSEVEQKGWRVALENRLGPNSPGILRSTAPNRLSWKYLIDMDESCKVLDIGAGTGGIACQLAKEHSVVALDKNRYNAAFMALRAKQDGLSRFEAVAADATSLPFESNQFDVAVMIGTLEWVPFSCTSEPPRQTQLRALSEINRVLKPGGKFFLGIENAHYLGYFLGVPEAHTSMRYISLMTEEQAENLSQDLRGRPFLELTHSKDECLALLNKAEFTSVQAFWLYPDYAFTNYFIPLDNPGIIKYFIEENLNAWNFRGNRGPVYYFYHLLDPKTIGEYVESFGFLAIKGQGK